MVGLEIQDDLSTVVTLGWVRGHRSTGSGLAVPRQQDAGPGGQSSALQVLRGCFLHKASLDRSN